MLDLRVDLKVYAGRVSASYRIKDVAERSGFNATTLRYYEEIGLLPAANRTPAGYRMYDDDTLERLAFIARAKQLGCTLEEIADLTMAWEGGVCGPVQDRLRVLVADKLSSARQQIDELTMLTTELRRAAATLEIHRPEGACDDRCGCVTVVERAPTETPEAPEAPVAQRVTLGSKPAAAAATPIACSLSAHAMQGRLDEWQQLLRHVATRESIDRGLRVTFDAATPIGEVARLSAAEQECCRFFDFAITIDDRGVALEVRAPADAAALVDSVFGVPA
jgi:MerR family transcriptional regulator, copper efflux regulator